MKRRPSRTFTVSLGIFLLEASLRGQSSSEERAERAFPLTSSLEAPTLTERPTVHDQTQHPSPWEHFCTNLGV